MGKILSLLSVKNGKPQIIEVKAKSNCYKCKKTLFSGQKCVEVSVQSGFISKRRYCNDCFDEILNKTRLDLDEITKDFTNLKNEA